MVQQSVENGYRKFLQLIAQGRNMTIEEVDKIAQGRVWAGQTAMDLGLVDEMGGLADAIHSAAQLSSISDYDVIYLSNQLSPKEQIIRQIMEASVLLLDDYFGSPGAGFLYQLTDDIRAISQLNDPNSIYSQCLQCKVL
jgi:protease-4